MEVNVLEREKNRMKIEFVTQDRTIPNLIAKEMWNDSSIVVSGYTLKHPQTANVTALIETDKKDVKKVVLDNLASMKKTFKELNTKFKKAVK
tara:strand:+ start:559 stop:834 length:276 start_codon:yes stop_codon:yes gene_type:complete